MWFVGLCVMGVNCVVWDVGWCVFVVLWWCDNIVISYFIMMVSEVK